MFCSVTHYTLQKLSWQHSFQLNTQYSLPSHFICLERKFIFFYSICLILSRVLTSIAPLVHLSAISAFLWQGLRKAFPTFIVTTGVQLCVLIFILFLHLRFSHLLFYFYFLLFNLILFKSKQSHPQKSKVN